MLRVNRAYPDLDGWAMVGGWAFFSDALMDRIDPQKLKIVAVDALPAQLPYVEKGIVPVLLGQPTFKWGKVSVEKIIDKIHLDKEVDEIHAFKADSRVESQSRRLGEAAQGVGLRGCARRIPDLCSG